jgi:hypothetical protein
MLVCGKGCTTLTRAWIAFVVRVSWGYYAGGPSSCSALPDRLAAPLPCRARQNSSLPLATSAKRQCLLTSPALVVTRASRRRRGPSYADSEHETRKLLRAELDAPSARQTRGCCRHESSHNPLALIHARE